MGDVSLNKEVATKFLKSSALAEILSVQVSCFRGQWRGLLDCRATNLEQSA